MIRELVEKSMYLVDERAVADAVILRSLAKCSVPGHMFQSEDRGPQARSFRRDRDARSFRLSGGRHARRVHH